ncbi:MAG: histidinol-phosphate transaminase [Lachnospiraceae bacterium]|nr:histidinol-phosphate transaminase [Lachnospiraceae bacterium]
MSRFFSSKYDALTPYTPGEQPLDMKYVKLNTNELPYPPSPLAVQMASEEAKRLQLYSDPECRSLKEAAAEILGFAPEEMIFTNGSDDILNFAFMAFCNSTHGAAFADITYGFYPVFAALNNVPYKIIPLREDFTIDPAPYMKEHSTIFIANPNAPTGIALPLSDVEAIISADPDRIVVVDEAYVDFGGESALPLIRRYDNLLVTQTFSKSRALAGGRLGVGFACPALIRDLETIRYSTNPYNINRMTMAAGVGALKDTAWFKQNVGKVAETRRNTVPALEALGFTVLPSSANFVFAKHKEAGGEELYQKLKEKGILVRHFSVERIRDFLRITIGTPEEMETLFKALSEILAEQDWRK